jgi:putative ABC transport system ATP-binding protein
MLHLQDLRYTWPGTASEVLAIDHLQLAAGRTLFLYGPSGCGKSTLLGLMAGVLVPSTGRVALLGQDWAQLSASKRDARRAAHVGVVFQQFNLLPYLSVMENVLLPCRFSAARAARCEGGADAAAKALLERVALPQALWQQSARTLSVGQQQRVAAARALIGAPELVIADEPTSALDGPLREDFMALLLGECQARGSTLVFVSHDERLSERFDEQLSLPVLNRARRANDDGDPASSSSSSASTASAASQPAQAGHLR